MIQQTAQLGNRHQLALGNRGDLLQDIVPGQTSLAFSIQTLHGEVCLNRCTGFGTTGNQAVGARFFRNQGSHEQTPGIFFARFKSNRFGFARWRNRLYNHRALVQGSAETIQYVDIQGNDIVDAGPIG